MRHFFILMAFGAGVALSPYMFTGAGGETFGKNRTASATGSLGIGSSSLRELVLDQAVQTGLRPSPVILNAIQEIERTKGVIREIRAQALPIYSWTA